MIAFSSRARLASIRFAAAAAVVLILLPPQENHPPRRAGEPGTVPHERQEQFFRVEWRDRTAARGPHAMVDEDRGIRGPWSQAPRLPLPVARRIRESA